MDHPGNRNGETGANGSPDGLSERIRAARRNLGWTQEQVALKVGITVRSVSGWESGKTVPHVGTLEVLARVLGQEPRRFTASAQVVTAQRRAERVEHVAGRIEGALNEMSRHLRLHV